MNIDRNSDEYKEIFVDNLKYILNKYSISQNDLAEKIDISSSQISKYINGKSEPSVYFLMGLKNMYGISIDEMLSINIEYFEECEKNKLNKMLNSGWEKFVGKYIAHYYNVDSKYGKNEKELKYGFIIVLETISENELKVVGRFNLSKEEALSIHNEANESVNMIDETVRRFKLDYSGKLSIKSEYIFFNLSSDVDKVSMIFNNPKSKKRYVGGVGTSNSISRGNVKLPSIHKVVISREEIYASKYIITSFLKPNNLEIKMTDEMKSFLNMCKKFYEEEQQYKLEDEDKMLFLENKMKNIIKSFIKENDSVCTKVYLYEDSDVYKLFKKSK